jgi:hypothetical protein
MRDGFTSLWGTVSGFLHPVVPSDASVPPEPWKIGRVPLNVGYRTVAQAK